MNNRIHLRNQNRSAKRVTKLSPKLAVASFVKIFTMSKLLSKFSSINKLFTFHNCHIHYNLKLKPFRPKNGVQYENLY